MSMTIILRIGKLRKQSSYHMESLSHLEFKPVSFLQGMIGEYCLV